MPTNPPRRAAAFVVVAAAALLACLPAEKTIGPLPDGGKHVLFIGNSLTYVNDLPRTLADLAASGGDTVRTATVANANYALVDHYFSGDSRKAIASQHWDFVVMQQGPTSTTGVDRDTLIYATQAFAPLIRAQGGTPALYMVWPDFSRFAFFDNTRDSYRFAAQAVNGVFIPAGEAWRTAWASDSTLSFYSADGLHPTPLGTFVAALTIYERVTGHDARALPKKAVVEGRDLGVSAATVSLLQTAAHQTNLTWPSARAR